MSAPVRSAPAGSRASRRWTPALLERGALAVMVLGGGLAMWPASSAVTPGRVPLPALPATAAVAAPAADTPPSAEAAGRVVRSNLFSARRQAPTVRYRDPLAPATPPHEGTEPADGAGVPGAPEASGEPRLLGVVEVDGVRKALVQWAPGVAGWCAEGRGCEGQGGRARARAIAPAAVELVMAGRVRTLRLPDGRHAESLSRMP